MESIALKQKRGQPVKKKKEERDNRENSARERSADFEGANPKIGIDPADPVTRSKPGTRALDRAWFKNYDANYYSYCRWFFFVQIN